MRTLDDLDGVSADENIAVRNYPAGRLVRAGRAGAVGAPHPGYAGDVVAAYEQFKLKNFTILGVSLDDDKENWLEAVQQDKLNWLQISDLKKWESTVVSAYQIQGIPFNVLLDPTGKIIATDLRGSALQNTLKQLLP